MKLNLLLTGVFALAVIANSCSPIKYPEKQVYARKETQPVQSASDLDAADDPAIWYNREEPENSLIIGTDKKAGLGVYALSGVRQSFLSCGEVNNVDLRYNYPLNDSLKIDIIATDERGRNTILLFALDTATYELLPLHPGDGIRTTLPEIYGLCMHYLASTGKYYVFVNDKSGRIQQFEIKNTGFQFDAILVDSLRVSSQPEGMVADDELDILFVGEEDRGIWKFPAKPGNKGPGELVISSTEKANREIKYDIEGLTIYYAAGHRGYLIASSQGNNAYAIFDRNTPHHFIGCFGIGDGNIDGTEDTDGIDVINLSLGPTFPNGVFIAQDGANYNDQKKLPQNFKLVDWGEIARLFEPSLLIDTTYRISDTD